MQSKLQATTETTGKDLDQQVIFSVSFCQRLDQFNGHYYTVAYSQ